MALNDCYKELQYLFCTQTAQPENSHKHQLFITNLLTIVPIFQGYEYFCNIMFQSLAEFVIHFGIL